MEDHTLPKAMFYTFEKIGLPKAKFLICRTIWCGRSTFEFENLGEFENKIENLLGYQSGA
ncbi:MAG: hypothetical protein AN484_27095 [Aphanizomenon flos-aquae WA102]|uniref:Uncharacterized protein n=1 Tax=Aphanizomenon flos-aquae WA102 TaxID=1710896 RepID=A0A1B7W989_APHFL|nr:MAG: hypothetical protein AN484_27095 [Aphanizomenon flos-aquae WA102]